MTQLIRTERDAGANRAIYHEEDEMRHCFGEEVAWKLAHCLEEHAKDGELSDPASPIRGCLFEVYGLVRSKAYDDIMKVAHGQRHQKVYYALLQSRPGVRV